jgi:hypothetical protein
MSDGLLIMICERFNVVLIRTLGLSKGYKNTSSDYVQGGGGISDSRILTPYPVPERCSKNVDDKLQHLTGPDFHEC